MTEVEKQVNFTQNPLDLIAKKCKKAHPLSGRSVCFSQMK